MALTKASLSGKFKAKISAVYTIVTDAELQKICDALAEAVVEEIQANGVVNVTGSVTSGVGAGGAVTAVGGVT